MSFKNTNTLQQLTKPKIVNNTQEQDNGGIYKLICNTSKSHTWDRQIVVLKRDVRNKSDT